MNAPTCISDADLGRLWEGDVTPQQRESLQRHIEACEDCRQRWEALCAGARTIEALQGSPAAQPAVPCPSEESIAAYVDDALGPDEKCRMEQHLAACERCCEVIRLVREVSESYAQDGDGWWDELVGRRILRLIAMAPEEMDGLMTLVEPVQVQAAPSGQTITLPMLRPTQAGPLRLAAATGEGFTEQVLRQDEPPFEFQLVQFGMQLRITVRALGEDSPFRDCLAKLRLREGDDVGLSRGVLVEKGEGRCTLEPDEVRALQPERQELTVRLEPLVALCQLAALGEEAYVPILTRLLAHEQPEVRGSAVQVLVQLRGPAAIPLIRPLVEDEDEGVQAAARRVLSRFEAG